MALGFQSNAFQSPGFQQTTGVAVVFYSGLSKARTRGLSINRIEVTSVGGGLYTVTESPDVSENQSDTVTYEGYEWVE